MYAGPLRVNLIYFNLNWTENNNTHAYYYWTPGYFFIFIHIFHLEVRIFNKNFKNL